MGLAHMATGTCSFQLRFPEPFEVAWKPPTIDVVHAVSPAYISYDSTQKKHISTVPDQGHNHSPAVRILLRLS